MESVARQLQMGDVDSWDYKDAFFASQKMITELACSERVILHWTVPHPSLKLKIRNLLLMKSYDKEVRLALIRMAERKTCVTLVADPDKLIERVRLREKRVRELRAEGRDSLTKYRRKIRDIRTLAAIYSDKSRLLPMYEQWFAFCEKMGVDQHYLADVNDSPVLTSIDDWGQFVTKWGSVR